MFCRLAVFAACAVASVHGQDDLFTGVPAEKLPIDAQRFLDSVKAAINTGEPASLVKLAYNKDMTGTAWVLFRARLPDVVKERKVTKIELSPEVADEDKEAKDGTIVLRANATPTHTIIARIEAPDGAKFTVELPAAKIADPNNNTERWRLTALVPQLPADSSMRLEKARQSVEASQGQWNSLIEFAYLNALLGRRAETEKHIASLLEQADGKAQASAGYIHQQVGWCWFHLGENKRALEHFKKAHETVQGKAGSYELALGVGQHINGQPELAVRHFDKAAGLFPAYSERKALEEQFKNNPPKERGAVLDLHSLWLRTMVPLQRQVSP